MAQPEPDPDPEGVLNSLLGNTRCCVYLPCFGSRGSSTVGLAFWQRIRPSQARRLPEDRWWRHAFIKIREWSEIVAGPRWKTFIRRFNRNRGAGSGVGVCCGGGGGDRNGQFQYDPLSYALNFDEGRGQYGDSDEDREYGGLWIFSKRYAAVPANPSKKTKGGFTTLP